MNIKPIFAASSNMQKTQEKWFKAHKTNSLALILPTL
jgi:hypothetical protein